MIFELRSRWVFCVVLGLSAACADDEPRARELEFEEASYRIGATTEHGELAFRTWIPAELSKSEPAHAWTFELAGRASVTLRTEASWEGDVDTVLSLYREGPHGWGRAIARNDDVSDAPLSALSRRLKAGRYRVVVAGHDASSVGTFIFASECTGAGCPKPAADCLLPASFPELRESEAFEPLATTVLTATSLPQLSETERAQLLATLRINYTETDAPTLEAAITFADRGEVNQQVFRHRESGRELVVYEHGAGDTSVGAVFDLAGTNVQAVISDSAFEDCRLEP